MTSSPLPAGPSIAEHRNVGASTGFMAGHYGRWAELVSLATGISTMAVELSALSEPELPSLVEYLRTTPPLPFAYVSVHAPSKDRTLPEAQRVAMLAALIPIVDAIVLHPDVMSDLSCYRELGATLVLENMDRRKPLGRTADELDRYFGELPEAGFCFDVPHCASVDDTLAVGHRLLDAHGHRLRHLHVSSLDADCGHHPLTAADEERFKPLLDRCRDVPWILEAPPSR